MAMAHLEGHAASLTAARAGDRAAFDLLVAGLTPLVWHVARAGGLHTTDAEEVVQTVWLTLLRDLDTVTTPAALATWLITTTRAAAGDRTSTPEEPDATVARDRRLLVAFRAVPAPSQEALRLSALAGQPMDPRHLAELREQL
jgi:hypothetical protein